MSFGLEIKNQSNLLTIDGDTTHYDLYSTGTVQSIYLDAYWGPEQTIPISGKIINIPTDGDYLLVFRPTTTIDGDYCCTISGVKKDHETYGISYALFSGIGFYFVHDNGDNTMSGGSQGFVDYRLYKKTTVGNPSIGNYGLEIFNASAQFVFNHEMSEVVKIEEVLELPQVDGPLVSPLFLSNSQKYYGLASVAIGELTQYTRLYDIGNATKDPFTVFFAYSFSAIRKHTDNNLHYLYIGTALSDPPHSYYLPLIKIF